MEEEALEVWRCCRWARRRRGLLWRAHPSDSSALVPRFHAGAWEICFGVFVCLFSLLAYTYINANFTAMMLRFYQQLERYRMRVQRVDNYLKRNHVRSRLRKLVREHFRQAYENENGDDDS